MFKKKNVYVNQKEKRTNVWVVGIVMLIIGITWTNNVYMFQDLQTDYKRSITIYNTAVSHRIDREEKRGGVMVQDTSVTDSVGAESHASQELIEIETLSLSVEEQIRQVAHQENFEDADLLVNIAFCESTLNPTATNPNSSATGLFQILDMHNLTVAERCDVETSTKWVINKINNGGLSAWNASKHCWG